MIGVIEEPNWDELAGTIPDGVCRRPVSRELVQNLDVLFVGERRACEFNVAVAADREFDRSDSNDCRRIDGKWHKQRKQTVDRTTCCSIVVLTSETK